MISVVSRSISSVISVIDLSSVVLVTDLILPDVGVSDLRELSENLIASGEDEIRYLIFSSKTTRFCLIFDRSTDQFVSQIDSSSVREHARC